MRRVKNAFQVREVGCDVSSEEGKRRVADVENGAEGVRVRFVYVEKARVERGRH